MKRITRSLSAALALSRAVTSAGAAAQPARTEARSGSLDAHLDAIAARQGGLTAADVRERARATSFDVRARRAEIEVAEAAVDQALVAFLPRLTAVVRYTRLSPLEDQELGRFASAPTVGEGRISRDAPLVNVDIALPSMKRQSVLQWTLVVPISDYVLRLSQGYSAASHSKNAARLNEEASRRMAAHGGEIAYYTWARARLSLFVARRALAQARSHLVDVKGAFASGAAPLADVLRVEAQVANAELVVQRADGLVNVMEQTVRTAMHAPAAESLAPGEDLRVIAEPFAGPRDVEALYAEALRRRPEIRALDETRWSLSEQAQVIRAGFLPRLDALGDVTLANPNPRVFPSRNEFTTTWSAGVQASWTLNDVGLSAAQSSGVDARRAQVEAQKGALADALRLEVTEALQALLDAEVAVVMTARALSAAEESHRARRELFRSGRATSVELTDAEVELARAELEVVSARVDLRVAAARLRHATGREAVAP
jgi:outer membrane protein